MSTSLVSWTDTLRGILRAREKTRGTHFLAADPFRFLSFIVRRGRRRDRRMRELGIPIPSYCMLSITGRCNLDCTGCYAKSFGAETDMPLDVIRRILAEAEDLGIHYFLVVGGEPLVVPGLMDLLGAARRTVFLLYTNATLLDETFVARIARAPNVLPVVSLEGDRADTDLRRGEGVFAKAQAAMRLMREARVLFGFCAMVTHRNVDLVTSRAWLDRMWHEGAVLGVLADYTPYPGECVEEFALTAEDRIRKRRLVEERKREARPYVVNFPPDEYRAGKCGSAGRVFMHISPSGRVEPCPLCRYSADNVNERTLKESLASPFFSELRRRSAVWDHDGESCMLLAHEAEVAAVAAETGAAHGERGETATCGQRAASGGRH